ncbi:MAG: O-antigen ligase family protein [Aulosira sp. ZfuVER01]|nr:O-antigen ligase family protein [Aulosira sp. ZfuVER01]MDZ8002599.1 O-antigen ligase family protein [Aulosira sp. DedVER01a]MDZ8050723.1 O-antigen ligase family protein [Aulosira sp. ZfuCHP01]
MRKILLFSEQVFTVFTLLVYSGGLLILILSGGANETDTTVNYDTSVYQLICVLIYLVTLFLLLLRWKSTIYVLTQNKLIWLLVGLSLFSILWSFAPGTTIKDSLRLIGSSLFGVYFASRYTLKQQMQLLAWMCGIAIVLSFIFAVALPKYGIMGGVHAGKWRGIFVHKNGLGASMLNSSIVFLLMAVGFKKNRQFFWLGFGLSVLLILLSSSTSALINLAMLIVLFVALRALWLPYYVMIPAILGIAIIGEIIYFGFTNSADLIFGLFGKSSNLSGRGDLWSYVFDMIWKQPWLGYGYGGFWNGWNGESAYIWRVQAWTPTHPHNGFLAIWLDLGLLGLSIFFLGFVINYIQSLAFVRVSRKIEAFFPVMHMTALLLTNLTETALLGTDSITWIIYIALAASMKIEMNEFMKRKNFYSIHQQQQNYLIQG